MYLVTPRNKLLALCSWKSKRPPHRTDSCGVISKAFIVVAATDSYQGRVAQIPEKHLAIDADRPKGYRGGLTRIGCRRRNSATKRSPATNLVRGKRAGTGRGQSKAADLRPVSLRQAVLLVSRRPFPRERRDGLSDKTIRQRTASADPNERNRCVHVRPLLRMRGVEVD